MNTYEIDIKRNADEVVIEEPVTLQRVTYYYLVTNLVLDAPST